jgi:hypothetical protein
MAWAAVSSDVAGGGTTAYDIVILEAKMEIPVATHLIGKPPLQLSIVVLKRRVCIPKQFWRERWCRRTLAPLTNAHALITRIWQANRRTLPDFSFVEQLLQPDGSAESPARICPIQDREKSLFDMFDFTFVPDGRIKVVLRGEVCSRQLGSPRRPTRHIAYLMPWKPIRILLNGRIQSGEAETLYVLQEYHLSLCAEPAPERLETIQFVDLQADLI